MNIIKTQKLTKTFLGGKVIGVKDLTLEINAGEIFGYIGPNGAGKSTTIKLLLDLIRPDSGNATVLDLDIHSDTNKIKEEIGYLPGEIFLQENLTGKETIKYYTGFKREVDPTYLASLIKKLELDLNKKISDYSKGNKQKLAIVLALMHKPKILILDEPTSGLDPLNQQTFYDIILETKNWGTTTFFSTHILQEAERICDRVGIIKNGKILSIENIEDFRKKNIRIINIETDRNIPLSDLKIGGVSKIERTREGYKIITHGENSEIIKKISKHEFVDLKISEPSLEEIFMHFYREGKND